MREREREIENDNATSFALTVNGVNLSGTFYVSMLCVNLKFHGNDTWRSEDVRSVIELLAIDKCARSRICGYSLALTISSLLQQDAIIVKLQHKCNSDLKVIFKRYEK